MLITAIFSDAISLNRFTLLHIHRPSPHDLQFDEALVSSAIVVYRKALPAPDHEVRFSFGGSLSTPELEQCVQVQECSVQRKWTQFPRRSINTIVVDSAKTVCLGDLFEINRGIATGANDFFILTREEAKQRQIPDQFLRPILPSPRFLTEPVIRSDPNGFPKIERQLVLLDCTISLAAVQAEYTRLAAYLEEGQRKGIDQRYLATKRNPWYRQERRAVAPFLCTYMGRELEERHPFRFFWNQSQALAPNVYLLLYPKQELAHTLRENPGFYEEVFQWLLAIDFVALIGEGRVYGGALHKIEPKELSRVALQVAKSFTDPKRQLSLF